MKKISRKQFIKLSSIVAGGTLLFPRWLYPFLSNSNNSNMLRDLFNDKILVIVNLNGGNDGLNTVIPYQDQNYYNLRPDIAIPNDSVIPITEQLGLHPSLTQLANFWNQEKLCIVENVGYSNQNLSHFRSTDIWQSGSDHNQVINTGWIARVLEQMYPNHANNLPETPMALLQGTTNNLLLTGEQGITGIQVDDPSSFLNLVSSTYYNSADNSIPDTSGGDELQYVRNIDNAAFEYAEYIQNVSDIGNNTMQYANNPLSVQLSTTAKLISGGMYSPFYIVYQGGYDTHSDQINRHGSLMNDLSLALYNFYTDLENQGLADKVIVMTTSEFGRRPYQNGGQGTDHGTAAPMFILGNAVNGGIIGSAPNLSSFDNNNLFYEYDFRQIYSSILNQHFGLNSSIVDNALLDSFDHLDIIQNSNTQIGDVNFDNQVNVIDVVIMVNFILGVTTPTNEEFIAADVNGDGELNVVDVVSNISNILDQNNNLSISPLSQSIKINQTYKSIEIPKNSQLAGLEIHFKNKCKILDSTIDDNWVIRIHGNKVILYSTDLKSMRKSFQIKFDRNSKINSVIASNKKGSVMSHSILNK